MRIPPILTRSDSQLDPFEHTTQHASTFTNFVSCILRVNIAGLYVLPSQPWTPTKMIQDAAAAALFAACKIEDTLKKSREVLCAAYNLKLAPSEHLSPDDPVFRTTSDAI